jgi:hypothetical protein
VWGWRGGTGAEESSRSLTLQTHPVLDGIERKTDGLEMWCRADVD